MNLPILSIVFNRPRQTQIVFEAIRAARPPRLYVAADFPRETSQKNIDTCEEVRRIATDVDWPCEVQVVFRKTNFGCKANVSQAISWFFETEKEGIILEDDCLPEPSFFRYCEELLARYRDDDRVALISGTNFSSTQFDSDESYRFSRHPYIWGWATWKRTWDLYDGNLSTWPEVRNSDWLKKSMGGFSDSAAYWKSIYDICYRGEMDSWGFPFHYSVLQEGMLTIIPKTPLVSNIGFGSDASHTRTMNPVLDSRTLPMNFPLVHPTEIVCWEEYDRWSDIHLRRVNSSVQRLGLFLAAKIPGFKKLMTRAKKLWEQLPFTKSDRKTKVEYADAKAANRSSTDL